MERHRTDARHRTTSIFIAIKALPRSFGGNDGARCAPLDTHAVEIGRALALVVSIHRPRRAIKATTRARSDAFLGVELRVRCIVARLRSTAYVLADLTSSSAPWRRCGTSARPDRPRKTHAFLCIKLHNDRRFSIAFLCGLLRFAVRSPRKVPSTQRPVHVQARPARPSTSPALKMSSLERGHRSARAHVRCVSLSSLVRAAHECTYVHAMRLFAFSIVSRRVRRHDRRRSHDHPPSL